MRSSVPSDAKPAASARRAQSTTPARPTRGTAVGSPIPISTNDLRLWARLLGAAELPDGDPEHQQPEQRDDARLEQSRHAPAEPRHAGVERGPRGRRDVEVREDRAAHRSTPYLGRSIRVK